MPSVLTVQHCAGKALTFNTKVHFHVLTVQHKLVSGASGPSPIALEFEEFGQEEDLGEDNDESLARYETPRGGKRKAAAQRKGTKRRQ